MKEYPHKIYEFMQTHDFPAMLAAFQKLELKDVLRSGYTWMIVLPILIFLLWTKKFKIILTMASCVAFLVLIKYTLTSTSETIPLHDLLVFAGGATAVIGFNLYMYFIHD